MRRGAFTWRQGIEATFWQLIVRLCARVGRHADNRLVELGVWPRRADTTPSGRGRS